MKKRKPLKLLAVCLLLTAAFGRQMRADVLDDQGTRLVLELTDGTATEYLLSDRPQISFGITTISFYSPDLFSATYERDEVADFRFETSATAVDPVAASKLRIAYQGNGRLVVDGIGENEQISVYTADGKSAGYGLSRNGRQTVVSLAALPTGYYIINLQHHNSFKIFKK